MVFNQEIFNAMEREIKSIERTEEKLNIIKKISGNIAEEAIKTTGEDIPEAYSFIGARKELLNTLNQNYAAVLRERYL